MSETAICDRCNATHNQAPTEHGTLCAECLAKHTLYLQSKEHLTLQEVGENLEACARDLEDKDFNELVVLKPEVNAPKGHTLKPSHLTGADANHLRASLRLIAQSHALEPHTQIAYQHLFNALDEQTGEISEPIEFSIFNHGDFQHPILIEKLAPAHVVATMEALGVSLRQHRMGIADTFTCSLAGVLEGRKENYLAVSSDMYRLGIGFNAAYPWRGEVAANASLLEALPHLRATQTLEGIAAD